MTRRPPDGRCGPSGAAWRSGHSRRSPRGPPRTAQPASGKVGPGRGTGWPAAKHARPPPAPPTPAHISRRPARWAWSSSDSASPSAASWQGDAQRPQLAPGRSARRAGPSRHGRPSCILLRLVQVRSLSRAARGALCRGEPSQRWRWPPTAGALYTRRPPRGRGRHARLSPPDGRRGAAAAKIPHRQRQRALQRGALRGQRPGARRARRSRRSGGLSGGRRPHRQRARLARGGERWRPGRPGGEQPASCWAEPVQ
jgi:hypothetical protein